MALYRDGVNRTRIASGNSTLVFCPDEGDFDAGFDRATTFSGMFDRLHRFAMTAVDELSGSRQADLLAFTIQHKLADDFYSLGRMLLSCLLDLGIGLVRNALLASGPFSLTSGCHSDTFDCFSSINKDYDANAYVYCDKGNDSAWGICGHSAPYDDAADKAFGDINMGNDITDPPEELQMFSGDGQQIRYLSDWIDGGNGYSYRIGF